MNFISAANKYGAESVAKNIGLDSLLDKKGNELYKGLIDYFARDFSTTDMQIIRESLSETWKRQLCDGDVGIFCEPNSVDSLVEAMQFAIKNFETCFAEKIFTNSELSKDYDRVMNDVGSAIENRIVADIQLEKKLDLDYTSKQGQEYISSVCKDCYADLKRMEGLYESMD